MNYWTSYLLIGGRVGVFLGGGSRKNIAVLVGAWGGGVHYMKNKNIGGMCFVNSTCSAKKARMQKCAQTKKKKIIKH